MGFKNYDLHDFDIAVETVRAVKKAGADAIKLQTYTPDTLTIDCDKEEFRIKGGLWDGYTLYKLYEMAQTPLEWHKELFEYSRKKERQCLNTEKGLVNLCKIT